MARTLYILGALILVIAVGITMVGCGGGPSNQAAHDAIWSFMQERYSDYYNVGSVKVLQIGKPMKMEFMGMEAVIYPVKVELTAKNGTPLGVQEFNVGQDSYGEWQAGRGSY
jgi:hypothetical protein